MFDPVAVLNPLFFNQFISQGEVAPHAISFYALFPQIFTECLFQQPDTVLNKAGGHGLNEAGGPGARITGRRWINDCISM